MNLPDWINNEFFGNTLLLWAIGASVIVLLFLVLLMTRRILCGRLGRLAERRKIKALTITDHIIGKTSSLFILLISVFVGSRFWELPESLDSAINTVTGIGFFVQAGLWVSAAFLRYTALRREEELRENPGAVAAMDVLSFVTRVAIWTIVLLVILDNLGVNITALVAGLGVGGIAVALAAQNILGDLFASLSIVLDKPFVVGDFLIIGEFLGSVEKVGIKTTRLRSLSGEQLVFSNNDLLGSRIRNYGRMYQRRVVFSIGVTYQTTAAQLRKIPEILRTAVEKQDKVRFDRAHFQKYGDFALIFEIVYYVESADYNQYMDIQQAINLQVFEAFEKDSIDFAYPTQTVFLEHASQPTPAP